MQWVEVPQDKLRLWASIIMENAFKGIGKDDMAMIKGEVTCWPLMAILEEMVVEAGAQPDMNVIAPNNFRGRIQSATAAHHGQPGQFDSPPDWYAARYQAMTHYVEVLGNAHPHLFSGLTPDQKGMLSSLDEQYLHTRLGKKWMVTLYPTAAGAAKEGMGLEEYVDFIVRASTTTDPTALRQVEEPLVSIFNSGKKITIVTQKPGHPEEFRLEMDLEHSQLILDCGDHNWPGGEGFTSPDARSAEGDIYLDLPVSYEGNDIEGIHLHLEKGRITRYEALRGHDVLAGIIETDEGSHRLGEVAVGMNVGIDRVLKEPLFVEKVGGTLHIAIGASYPECFVDDPKSEEGQRRIEGLIKAGICVRSAQHVDIVADFRPGGCGRRVVIDDDTELVVDPEKLYWVPKV
ncbi:MAG: aminopeptidase [Parcubacteria group bacterium]|nr:aminopeptidase [Parcubacteria group bacterium]